MKMIAMPPRQLDNSHQQGWSTIEFLLTFPVLVAVFLMAVYFGLLTKSKMALSNATYAGVQALAKTRKCDVAMQFVQANFDQISVEQVTCTVDDDRSILETKYVYEGTNILFLMIPPTPLTAKAVAATDEE
jgi:Flp pilus assembly protein TadG